MPIESRNPATQHVAATYEPMSDHAIDAALSRAEDACDALRIMAVRDRAAALLRLADVLDQHQEKLATLATEEMGKTLASAKAEVAKCASVCRYYAEEGPGFLRDEPVKIDQGSAYVAHLPIGPVLAVMPWNFPFWQVFRFAAPALMAGNPGLLKHASNVPRCAIAIEAAIQEAGFPEAAFQTLLIGADKVDAIIRDRRVRGVTLTGSGPAGEAVGRTAGETIKPSVLELGGSDAFIVMPSADLDAAAAAATIGRTMNNGQSCIAAKRFIIHNDVYDAFKDRLVARFEALKVGDPMADDTDIGPLVNKQAVDDTISQVYATMSSGGTRLIGGERGEVDGFPEGNWLTPGLIENVPPGAPTYRDEVFAPVGLMFRTPDLDAAIDLANDSDFGLGSTIFTQEKVDVVHAVRRLDAGSTAVNRIVASDPRLPFGGTKTSGYGRELARDGMMAFVNRKTVTLSGF